jgi:hypothetical protein
MQRWYALCKCKGGLAGFLQHFFLKKKVLMLELNKTYLYFIHLQLTVYCTVDQRNIIQKETQNVQVTQTTEKANKTYLCKLSSRAGFCQGLCSGSVLGGKLLAMSAPLQTSGKLMPSANREKGKKAADLCFLDTSKLRDHRSRKISLKGLCSRDGLGF